MHELGTHEGCIEQTNRLFKDRLYGENASLDLDGTGRIRLDDWEMDEKVQKRIKELWPSVNTDNLLDVTNFSEYQSEFLRLLDLGLMGSITRKIIDPVQPF